MTTKGHDFTCDECGKAFVIPFEDYRGQWDHGGEPLCPDCVEELENACQKCGGTGWRRDSRFRRVKCDDCWSDNGPE